MIKVNDLGIIMHVKMCEVSIFHYSKVISVLILFYFCLKVTSVLKLFYFCGYKVLEKAILRLQVKLIREMFLALF